MVTKDDSLYGVRVSPHGTGDSRALRGLLTDVEVLDFHEGVAEDYAEIRADLKARGRLMGASDRHWQRPSTPRWSPGTGGWQGCRGTASS